MLNTLTVILSPTRCGARHNKPRHSSLGALLKVLRGIFGPSDANSGPILPETYGQIRYDPTIVAEDILKVSLRQLCQFSIILLPQKQTNKQTSTRDQTQNLAGRGKNNDITIGVSDTNMQKISSMEQLL